MINYIERITKPIIDFKKDLFPILENINDKNIHTLINSLEISVSNGWVGVASELSDCLLNSTIIQNNPKFLINVHLERMKKFQYFELCNQAKQVSEVVLKLLRKYSSLIDKDTFDLWEFTAIAQIGWIEEDIRTLEQIIERGKSVSQQSSAKNKRIMEAFLTGLSGKKHFMNKSIELGKKDFSSSINQLLELNYFRAVAHLKIYFAENLYKYSSKKECYKMATGMMNENEITRFKSHLVLRVYSLLIKSGINKEKNQKYILSMQVLMFAMGLGQSQKIYPFVKSIFDLIPKNKSIDFFNINFRIWLDETIKNMSWEDYESLLLTFHKDKGYFFAEKLPKNFPVFDLIVKDVYDGNELVTLIQAKHWKSKVRQNNIPDSFSFDNAYKELEERYNCNSIDFVKYYALSGIFTNAVDRIEYNAKSNNNPKVKVNIITGNDEIIDFYLKRPKKIMNLFVNYSRNHE